MPCHVVFDVTRVGYRGWWMAAISLLIAAVAVFWAAVYIKAWGSRFHRFWKTFYAALALFMIGVALLGLVSTYSEYATLRDALQSGHFQPVAGWVTQFVPADSGDHIPERFRVNGHEYEYSWSTWTEAFHRTQPHGGPVHEGAYVRIADVEGQIARLEICDSASAAAR